VLPVGSIVIGVDDLERQAGFWQQALGCARRAGDGDDFALLSPPNGTGPNVSPDRVRSSLHIPPRVHLDLFAEDREAEVQRLLELGASEIHWDQRPPGADSVILADPEGNRFCVVDASCRARDPRSMHREVYPGRRMRPPEEQHAHITRTVDVSLPEEGLMGLLAEGRPLRVKLGVDPTAPDVTLGWAVVFDLLRRFQEMGHTAVLIVGDFTAQVGDPSEKSETRKRLSADEVRGYAERLLPVIRTQLLAERLEIRYNSEWLGAMSMHDVLELTSDFTVARIMDRDDFTKRWDAHEPISMIEFMYPLLQGMDSVAVEADIEIGGTDQLWNLLVGRDLQERRGQRGQVVATVPLLVGTDGVKKMSQSLGNYVSVRDEPGEMFGKTMSIPDEAMPDWYRLGAFAPPEEVDAIVEGLADGTIHPGAAKRELGRRVVTRHHGPEAAAVAEAAFDRLFKAHEVPEEIPAFILEGRGEVSLPAILGDAGLVASRSEARRLIKQGAVKIDGERGVSEFVDAGDLDGAVIQVGKRRFVRIDLR